jgi:hypothetical protein
MVIAIANGAVRQFWLLPWLGEHAALPLSGILLTILIFLVSLTTVKPIGIRNLGQAWATGLLWLGLTIAFEFLFGHFALGQSWRQLTTAYSPGNDNLWLLVLFSTLVSPFFAAKSRGLI